MNYDGSESKVIFETTEKHFQPPSIDGFAIDVVNKRLYVGVNDNITVIDSAGNVIYHLTWTTLKNVPSGDIVVFGEQLIKSTPLSFEAINKHGLSLYSSMFGKTDCFGPKLVHPALQPMGIDKCAESGCDGLCSSTASGLRCIRMNENNNFTCYATAIE